MDLAQLGKDLLADKLGGGAGGVMDAIAKLTGGGGGRSTSASSPAS